MDIAHHVVRHGLLSGTAPDSGRWLRAICCISLVLTAPAAYSATFVAGGCPGATRANFQTAFNALGVMSGPHTLRLCPGSHQTPPITANWGHAGLIIESVSGNANDTFLESTSQVLFSIPWQAITFDSVSLTGDIVAGTGGDPLTLVDVVLNGSIDSGMGITTIGSSIFGDITATNGPIELSGGVVDGNVGTNGNGQTITLHEMTVLGGSIQTGGASISISSSTLGSTNSPVPVTANNGITVSDSEIWGDLGTLNWAQIELDPVTTVHGVCTPDPVGGGTCDDTAPTAVVVGKIGLGMARAEDFLEFLSTPDREQDRLLELLRVWDPIATREFADDANLAELWRALLEFLDPDGDGNVAVLRWETLEERGTIGFFVERRGPDEPWARVNDTMLPGLITAPMGGEYWLADPQARPGVQYEYRLIEQEARGSTRIYGPFRLEIR